MIAVSYLREVYFSKRLDRTTLHQSKITDWRFNDSWPEFVSDFLQTATYPKPSSSKYECFGWTPTVFRPSTNDRGEEGVWRDSRLVHDHLTLFIADMDNQFADREMIPLDVLEAFLTSLGLSFVLYTSFTHKADRHKVRIIAPVSRPLTPAEAFKVFTWFNHALDYQLDGSVYDPGDLPRIVEGASGQPLHGRIEVADPARPLRQGMGPVTRIADQGRSLDPLQRNGRLFWRVLRPPVWLPSL